MSNARKRPKNLLLDPDAVARGERYSERHGTNLSRLVGDFLRGLPLDTPGTSLSPPVQRLWGVAARSQSSRDSYRAHLYKKYRGR